MDSENILDELKHDNVQSMEEHLVGDLTAWLEVLGFCVVIAFFSALITHMYMLYLTVADTLSTPLPFMVV